MTVCKGVYRLERDSEMTETPLPWKLCSLGTLFNITTYCCGPYP